MGARTIQYPYGTHTTIEYSLTYTGFKEDIVVSRYTGEDMTVSYTMDIFGTFRVSKITIGRDEYEQE